MKIFFYKTVTFFFLLFILYKLTIYSTYKKIKSELDFFYSKENVEHIKNKIKNEITKSLGKEKIINKDDAILLNKFINKIKDDLK